MGYLAKFHTEFAHCPCGTPLKESEYSAFCVACANATCSSECHQKYFKEPGLCTFHKNFIKDLKSINMRSLTLRQNNKYHEENASPGTPVCMTSRAFLYGMTSEDPNVIYLQRGYRQYGEMQEASYKALEFYKTENLDFIFHKNRICGCDCTQCDPRDVHPVMNCVNACWDGEGHIKQDFMYHDGIFDACDCKCKFCTSGVTVHTHTRMDCLVYCENSMYKTQYGL